MELFDENGKLTTEYSKLVDRKHVKYLQKPIPQAWRPCGLCGFDNCLRLRAPEGLTRHTSFPCDGRRV